MKKETKKSILFYAASCSVIHGFTYLASISGNDNSMAVVWLLRLGSSCSLPWLDAHLCLGLSL